MKIKNTDLRIGNLVNYFDDNTICRVLGIDKTMINIETQNEAKDETWIETEYFEPIPLTEEWLIKMGFEKINTDWYAYKGGNFRLNISFDVEWANNWMGIRIKYVHTLQNLFHSLTGNELTIKS